MLSLDLHHRRGDFTIDVAFESCRRITGVFGPSGAGKTTLLHAIAGLIRPDRGRAALDGRTLFDTAAGVHLPPHRRRVGVVFQGDRLLPHLSVEGNLRYAERLARRHEPVMSRATVVDLLGLGDLLSRRTHALSGGERQRVALGRTLLGAPQLLLLDEPVASLDERRKQQILPILRRTCTEADIPILYVSHDLAEVLQLTDELVVIDGGRVVGRGAYRSLAHEPDVLETMHHDGLVNVLRLVVAGTRADLGLTELAGISSGTAPGGGRPTLLAPVAGHADGATVDVAVRPSDIALAADRVEAISIQNQIPGRVTRVTEHAGRSLVEVDVGVELLVAVSRKTVMEMALAPGAAVWCLIKVNAVRYL